jgi:hypothetical protein
MTSSGVLLSYLFKSLSRILIRGLFTWIRRLPVYYHLLSLLFHSWRFILFVLTGPGSDPPPLHFLLYLFEDLRRNDCFMASFDIDLRDFALILLSFLGQEVDGIGLLQEGISLVLLIGQDVADGFRIPDVFSGRCPDPLLCQDLCNAVIGLPSEEELIDPSDNDGFLFINDRLALWAPVIA